MAILQARPTLRDIGVKTGFHYSTVSLALRDHPRISNSTKQIIRKAAEGLWLPTRRHAQFPLCLPPDETAAEGTDGDRVDNKPPHQNWLGNVRLYTGLFRWCIATCDGTRLPNGNILAR